MSNPLSLARTHTHTPFLSICLTLTHSHTHPHSFYCICLTSNFPTNYCSTASQTEVKGQNACLKNVFSLSFICLFFLSFLQDFLFYLYNECFEHILVLLDIFDSTLLLPFYISFVSCEQQYLQFKRINRIRSMVSLRRFELRKENNDTLTFFL